jgi:hypothetical protein
MKGNLIPQFCDHDCVCDFVICIGITQHMKELNINLQGANHLNNAVFDKITAFERKL